MNDPITTFYTAFQQQDAEAMAACYHKSIRFEDPAFGVLHGEDAKDMWRMLCGNSKGLKLEFSGIECTATSGQAHWEAWYTFSKTGREVHNRIDASFELQDGLIICHTDVFDVHRWATQAMGLKGRLLGGTGFFKKKLQAQTQSLLKKYQAKADKK